MWYIFDTNFTLRGIMDDDINEIRIEHHFYECDTLTFDAPYTKELYEALAVGRILYRKNQPKGFRIHSLEIHEAEKRIVGDAYGLEAILNQRVVDSPLAYQYTAEWCMHWLVDGFLINPKDPARKIKDLYLMPHANMGDILDEMWLGDSLYTILSELSKTYNIGYRFNYYPVSERDEMGNILFQPRINFETYHGQDRTINQTQNEPIRWSNRWGDTRDEMFLLSNKDYISSTYVRSGDEELPLQLIVQQPNSTGWNRFESFNHATDISRSPGEDIILTDTQVLNILRARGKLELYQRYLQNDFLFTLNEDITQIFGVDFNVGDKVSVINENYGIVKHSRIITVEETIIQGKSQFQVKFEE